jgi:hypothetical protein
MYQFKLLGKVLGNLANRFDQLTRMTEILKDYRYCCISIDEYIIIGISRPMYYSFRKNNNIWLKSQVFYIGQYLVLIYRTRELLYILL